MTTLLISKVNDINIIQVGESKLIVKNKSQNADKVGGFKGSFGGVGFSGQNKTVDIGKGRKEVSLRVFVDDRGDNDALFYILYNKRFCTIVDKFKGKIKVYVDSVTVTDSDKHVDRTIFDIKATVQDFDKAATPDYKQALEIIVDVVKSRPLTDDWMKLRTLPARFRNKLTIGRMVKGITSSTSLKMGAGSVYDKILGKLAIAQGVSDAIQGYESRITKLIDNISALGDPLSDTSTGGSDKGSSKPAKFTTDTDEGYIKDNENITHVTHVPIAHPQIRGQNLEDIDKTTLSQIEKEDLELEIICAEIVNSTKLIVDMKSVLRGGFASRDDFELSVNQIVERLDYVGYSADEIAYITYIVKSYAHQQQYKNVITINVPIAKPLVRIVYEKYGNLDNYRRVESLNGFKDNDSVSGKVRLFA